MVLTKPGYGTIVEAAALGIPVVYVRRYNFADEQSLVDYLHQYGRGAELSLVDFRRGQWEAAIDQALAQSRASTPPALSGAQDAAQVLKQYL
jgi:UDP-N-acetylglucosamine:LPS N-acetylglucosamine transferase